MQQTSQLQSPNPQEISTRHSPPLCRPFQANPKLTFQALHRDSFTPPHPPTAINHASHPIRAPPSRTLLPLPFACTPTVPLIHACTRLQVAAPIHASSMPLTSCNRKRHARSTPRLCVLPVDVIARAEIVCIGAWRLLIESLGYACAPRCRLDCFVVPQRCGRNALGRGLRGFGGRGDGASGM